MIEKKEDVLYADDLDDCLIGHIQIANKVIALYSTAEVIKQLMGDGMNEAEAWDFFEYNIVGAYMGGLTPAFTIEEV